MPRHSNRLFLERLEVRYALAALGYAPNEIIGKSDADRPWSVYAADLDGDGDVDVLSSSLDDDKVAWYENIDGRGSFGPQQIIAETGDFRVLAAEGRIPGVRKASW